MGFFLSKTWPFWLLAALLAALVAWLLCRWWAGRRGAVTDPATVHQLATTQALLRTREADLERVASQRNGHLAELEALRPKAAAHDELTAQHRQLAAQHGELTARLDGLTAASVPIAEHRARVAELEGRLAHRELAKPDVSGAAQVLGFAVAVDDLTVVEGIGPKIAGLFHDAGIHTWRQLSQTPVRRLQDILDAAGPRYQVHAPATWPRQAALLADGHWEPFKSWTDQLSGGRSAE